MPDRPLLSDWSARQLRARAQAYAAQAETITTHGVRVLLERLAERYRFVAEQLESEDGDDCSG
jgi:hypothetical protein